MKFLSQRAERLFKSICSSIEQPMAQTSSSKGDIVMKLRENPSNDFSCIHEKLSPESTALSKLKVISSVAAALLDVRILGAPQSAPRFTLYKMLSFSPSDGVASV